MENLMPKKIKEEKPEIILNDIMSVHWRKFLDKFSEIDSLPLEKWKEVHFLSHICRRYEAFYKKKFALSFKGAPSKSSEIYLIRRMFLMLNTNDKNYIKNYIDWCFDKKIIPQNLKIRTLAFFGNSNSVNEFNALVQESNKIVRSKELPEQYRGIASSLNISVSSYGDLAFIKMALDQDPDAPSRAPYRELFSKLQSVGFDLSILENLK